MCLILAQFLYSLSRKIQLSALTTAFFECSKILPQSLSVSRDTTEAVKAAINFLTEAAVDRHLLSNLPLQFILE